MFTQFTSLPHIHIGKGMAIQIGEVVNKKQGKNVLIINDGMISLTKFAEILALLRRQVKLMQIVEVNQIDAVSKSKERITSLFCKQNYDTVIGIGNMRTLQKTTKVANLLMEKCSQFAKVSSAIHRVPPDKNIILIPTVISTGEEFYQKYKIDETGHQLTNRLKSIPTTIIYDPLLTKVTPPPMLAATSVDSLSHALDTYFFSSHSAYIRKISRISLQLFFDNLIPAIYHEKNVRAREKLVLAGALASKAKFYQRYTFVDSLTEPLEKIFHLSHSVATAIILPYLIDFYKAIGDDLSRVIFNNHERTAKSTNPLPLAPYVQHTLAALGFPTTLATFNITQEHVQTLVLHWKKSIENDAEMKLCTDIKHVKQIYSQAIIGTFLHSS